MNDLRYQLSKGSMLVLLLALSLGVESVTAKDNHPDEGNYIHFPSWTVYLRRHPGYQNYELPKDIKKNGAKWGAWVTFPQKIEAIEARVGNITKPFDLFLSQDFLAMYKHPDYYIDAVLAYLADGQYSLQQKKIALYATSKGHIVPLEDYYQLYKHGKIDLDLLELSFAIRLVNHTRFSYNECTKSLALLDAIPIRKGKLRDFLQKVMQETPADASIHNNLKALFEGVLPAAWREKIFNTSIRSAYYTAPLLFLEVIRYAEIERKASETMMFGDVFYGLEAPPYFLMVMEHPQFYYFGYFNDNEKVENGTRVLRDPGFSSEEKAMAIFGASQLGVTSSEESYIYASFINSACEWYRKGKLSVGHLYQLFRCEIPSFYEQPFTTFYKYPFFILDYKDKSIQKALDKFMAEPTIPDGLKALARKVKNGTLATKEEMAYMEGYRQFRKTHFTLYETIPPRRK